ncbi:uncharacterized protein AMSG_03383 [Thecamonas trahens ATCC 50062]|uniref:Uncharacterized protein n=1 Tax=Thecamonas trahens ATCC 50062 TaxID=461836 RepID=A0A0L0D3Y2_THETB|nr:hypothetical protein AMSG_03383 [Thecamonas trahens ATCC 50062]KNC46950.1 hypothetical protein AMSG_03383 [Thecamonas trahens ATCC 50062]|eukprot:XP_013760221.1 hypothetical protein AMSG_03383 [Thecamonas trahens ATCC 50062]
MESPTPAAAALEAVYDQLRLVQGQRLALDALYKDLRLRLKQTILVERELLDKVDDAWRDWNREAVAAAMDRERQRRLDTPSSAPPDGVSPLASVVEHELKEKASRLRARLDAEIERERRMAESDLDTVLEARDSDDSHWDMKEELVRKANAMWASRAALSEANRRVRAAADVDSVDLPALEPEVKAELVRKSSEVFRRMQDEAVREERIRDALEADANERAAAAAAADADAEAERERRLAADAKAAAQDELVRRRAQAVADAQAAAEQLRRVESDELRLARENEVPGAELVRHDLVSAVNRRAARKLYDAEAAAAVESKIRAAGSRSMSTALLEEIERTAGRLYVLRRADAEQARREAEDSGPAMDDAALQLREDVSRAAAARAATIAAEEERLRRLREVFEEEEAARAEAGAEAIAAMEAERERRVAEEIGSSAAADAARCAARNAARNAMDAEQARRLAEAHPPKTLDAETAEALLRAAGQAYATRAMDAEQARRLAELDAQEASARAELSALAVQMAETERQARVAMASRAELVATLERRAAQAEALEAIESEQLRRIYSGEGGPHPVAQSAEAVRELARRVAERNQAPAAGLSLSRSREELVTRAERLSVRHAAEAERKRRVDAHAAAADAACNEAAASRAAAIRAAETSRAEVAAAANHTAVIEELERVRGRAAAVAAMEVARSERSALAAHASVQEQLAVAGSRARAGQLYSTGVAEASVLSPRSHMQAAASFGAEFGDVHSQLQRLAAGAEARAAAELARSERAQQAAELETYHRAEARATAAAAAEAECVFRIARDSRTEVNEDVLRALARRAAVRDMERERRERMSALDSTLPPPHSPRWYARAEALERRANQFQARRLVAQEQAARAAAAAAAYDFIDDPALSLDVKLQLMEEVNRREARQ